MREYYKIKNPIYLLALKTIVSDEKDDNNTGMGFDKRKIQEYIHKAQKDRDVTIPMSSVQVTYNFINKLRKYADSSDLLKKSYDMLDVHVERIAEKGWNEENFRTVNNTLDVIDFIIRNYSMYSNDDEELETISNFLTDTVTAYKMLCAWLPSVVIDDEDGNEYVQEYIDADGHIKTRIQKKDKRQRSYNQSTLGDTVLSSFPHRNFFTLFEKHPEKLVHDVTIRKAIILLFYMNYARNLIQEISNPNATDEETWKLSKVITVVLGIIAIGIGVMKPGSIFQIVLFAFGGLGIWAAPILLGMYWKRTTTAGVYVGVISAEILYVLITLKFTSWSFGFNPLIVAWLFAMIVIILVSLVTKPVSQETLDRHFADLERVKG